MFPRRSTVTRVFLCVAMGAVLFLVWVASPAARVPMEECNRFLREPSNETALRIEIAHMRTKMNMSTVVEPVEDKSVEWLRDQAYELCRSLPINPHNFHYIINPSTVCRGLDLFMIIYVHSAPDHYKRRTSIRETWGNPKNFDHLTVRLVFLVGKPKEDSIQEALLMESDMYGDIVQEDFMDSYRNLTYKGIMGLKWVKNYCSHAKFVLKTDDDIFVNIFNVVSHLEELDQQSGPVRSLLLCLVWTRMKVVRDPKSKWYLSKEEFSGDYFPKYCSGSAFMMTPDVSADMYQASLTTKFFWVDDFYVTGLLAQRVGVVHKKYNTVYTLGPSTFLSKFTEDEKWKTLTFGHVHNINHMVQVWKLVLKDKRPAPVVDNKQLPSNRTKQQLNNILRFIH